MTKIGVEENVDGEKIKNEKIDENDEEVDEILAPSGLANSPYPPPQYGAQGPAADPYAAPQAGVPAYAQPPPAPQSLAPSPQPVIINIQQNASSQNLAPATPQAPIGNAFGHENVYCKCPFCGHQGMTVLDKKAGNLAWTMCFIMFCFFPPCCCLPFCVPSFMDTYHHCAMCKQQVGSKIT